MVIGRYGGDSGDGDSGDGDSGTTFHWPSSPPYMPSLRPREWTCRVYSNGEGAQSCMRTRLSAYIIGQIGNAIREALKVCYKPPIAVSIKFRPTVLWEQRGREREGEERERRNRERGRERKRNEWRREGQRSDLHQC